MAAQRTYRVAPNLTNTLVLEGAVIAELVGEDGSPIAGEPCQITLPGQGDPTVGVTDSRGQFRVPHEFELSGRDATISFPDLDDDAWELVAEPDPPESEEP